jgi:superfamily II DNA/RNA helicase
MALPPKPFKKKPANRHYQGQKPSDQNNDKYKKKPNYNHNPKPNPKKKQPSEILEFVKFNPSPKTFTADEVRQKTRELIINANAALDELRGGRNRIALIQAPTASGKTHSIIDEIKNRDLSGKVAIAIPTRANVFNLSMLTDSLDIDFGTHVGGEDGEDKVETNIGTIYTYGKLYEVIKHDPLLSDYEELILDEADMITHGYETRWIPYLIWLLKARPELKIILVSATLDIEGFSKLFKVDERCIFQLHDLRPRPITQYYLSEDESLAYNLVAPFVASRYKAATLKAVSEQLQGKDKMVGGEALIIFMPTISSANKTANDLKNEYGTDNLDIRVLHSRIDRDVIEDGISRPIPTNKIGIIVATDIIGRGINFGNELRINRVIHSGLVNQRIYNATIRRDILQVGLASHNEVKQAIGRAGRHVQDGRDVIGICMMPYTQLKNNLATSLRDTDPTMMILQSIVVYNAIIDSNLVIHETLLEYISNVDINKKLVKLSLRRLEQIGAINENSQITDLGRFLASSNIDPDCGLLLYNIKSEKYEQYCDSLALVMRSFSLVDPENRELFNGAIMALVSQRKIKSDMDIYKYFSELITNRDEAELMGVNYNMYNEALRTAKNLKNLAHASDHVGLQLDKPLIINNLLIFKGIKFTNYGDVLEYVHIASGTPVEVDRFSVIYMQEPPKFAFAFNVSLLGDRYVASELVPTTIEELLKYEDPILEHVDNAMLNYDPIKGEGNFDMNLVYKGYYKDTILTTHNVTFVKGDKCYQGLSQYIVPKLPRAMKNLAKRVELANPKYNSEQILESTVFNYLKTNDIKKYTKGIKIELDINDFDVDPDKLPPEFVVISGQEFRIDYVSDYRVISVPIEKVLDIDVSFDAYHINTTTNSKPVYRTIKSVRYLAQKSMVLKLQLKALKAAKRTFLGNMADIKTPPTLPQPKEYYPDHFIHPYFTKNNGDVYIEWSKKPIDSSKFFG